MSFTGSIRLAGLMLLFTGFLLVSPSRGGTLWDNFNDNFINPSMWAVEIWNPGPTVAEANGRLEITIPADTVDDVFAALYLKYIMNGDFDQQVDFDLLTWPAGNGVSIGLGSSFLFNVYRKSYSPAEGGPKEEYLISCLGGTLNNIPTTDTSGKLRLTRTGTRMEGFYWQNNDWQLIASFDNPIFEGEMEVEIDASAAYLTGQTVMVGLDNYQVTNRYIGNCPPYLPLLLD